MDFSIKGLMSNPIMAVINPAAIPVVAGNMIKDKNPNMFSGLFSGFGVKKNTPGSITDINDTDTNTKYYIIGGIILFIIFFFVMKSKK